MGGPATESASNWQVSIIGPAGAPVGGGVLVPPRYVMTCAHVVTAALGRKLQDPARATLTVALAGGLRLTCSLGGGHRYTGGSGHQDVAVLALHGDLGRANGLFPTVHTHLSGSDMDATDRRMNVYGYPRGQDDGVWARCVVAGERLNRTLIQLDAEPGSGRAVEKGFSGSGVQDMETRRVVGIAVLRDKAAPVSWMIPMRRIAESWPPLRAALALSGEPPSPAAPRPHDPYGDPFGPEAMDQLYRLLLDGQVPLSGLVELRAQAAQPVHREWTGAPEDVLGIVQDLRDMAQGVRPVPPLLVFVAALAQRIPGARGQQLAHWVRDRAGHCDPAVDPVPLLTRRPRVASRLATWTYAIFQITPAAASRHYLLDVFRQREGAPRQAVAQYPEGMRLPQLEQLVVDQITRMRRERAIGSPELFVEFVLPRELLSRPLDDLPIVTPSGAQVRLGVVHPVAVRSLERQNAPEWRDWGHSWAQKWDRMTSVAALSGEGVVGVIHARSLDKAVHEALFATLYAEGGPVALVLGFPPKAPRRRDPDAEFDAALDAGMPALIWAHEPGDGKRVIDGVLARLPGESPSGLPEVVLRARRGERPAGSSGAALTVSGLRLGLLWDPFDRLPPHTPLA
ncbi:trypsin-like peptidase domain-containing protein, partial [Streptomyces sp. YC419]|nr:trypsin-like peptidase domain-containing protein [Streptomyces ureilyticus]